MTGSTDRWSRVSALFHEARQRHGRERAEFLDEACGADSALKAELEELLGADAGADGFLGRQRCRFAPARRCRRW
jgi:hypothetical protein